MKVATTMLCSLIFALAACGADADRNADLSGLDGEPVTPAIDVGAFKLYEAPQFEPDPGCDVHTVLQLVDGVAGPVAIIERRVDGVCEIAITEKPRSYNLTELPSVCGTRAFAGTLTDERGVAYQIEILDYRKRTCGDRVPAQIVLSETAGERVRRLYSAR